MLGGFRDLDVFAAIHRRLHSPSSWNADDEYERTLVSFDRLISGHFDDDAYSTFDQFGTKGYRLAVGRRHIEFLRELNEKLRASDSVFTMEFVLRWIALNKLLIEHYEPRDISDEILLAESLAIATFAAFPLLEELARRVAGCWNDEGVITQQVPRPAGARRSKKNRKRDAHTYGVGNQINSLSDKLWLMKRQLPPRVQGTLEELDVALSKGPIVGINISMSPLFERLVFWRNRRSHGRRSDGIEVWFITYLLAIVYFGIAQNKPS